MQKMSWHFSVLDGEFRKLVVATVLAAVVIVILKDLSPSLSPIIYCIYICFSFIQLSSFTAVGKDTRSLLLDQQARSSKHWQWAQGVDTHLALALHPGESSLRDDLHIWQSQGRMRPHASSIWWLARLLFELRKLLGTVRDIINMEISVSCQPPQVLLERKLVFLISKPAALSLGLIHEKH